MNALQPSLFISHGTPDIAVRDIPASAFLKKLGQSMPRPKAIVVASAHWCTHIPVTSIAPKQHALYDFFGFGRKVYDVTYDAQGSPDIGRQISGLLSRKGITNDVQTRAGMDHGVWTPLVHLFPLRDIPVIPISTQPLQDPLHHFELGRALSTLRSENVLIIGSGAITHNLSAMMPTQGATPSDPLAEEFSQWVSEAVETGDIDTLLDFRHKGPNYRHNHPTDEHFLPLFISLGAGLNQPGTRIHHSWTHGALALDSYMFGSASD